MMNNKILETERLILEELQQKHFDDLCELLSNENVHRYFPKTLNRDESKDFLAKVQQSYLDNGFSFWAVIRKIDSLFLGICGLLKQCIDDKEEIEVGYRINDKFWGNNYATEAAKGCLKFAKEKLGSKTVISLIREINIQSIRVAEKNGLKFEKETIFCDLPHRVYRIKF